MQNSKDDSTRFSMVLAEPNQRRALRLRGVLVAMILFLIVSVADGQTCSPYSASTCKDIDCDNPTNTLLLNVTKDEPFKPGQRRCYRVKIQESNQLAQVVVDQHGIDVATTLCNIKSGPMAIIDTPSGTKGREVVSWVTHQPGDYNLVVESPESIGSPGTIEITFTVLANADPNDEELIKAQWQLSAAEILSEQEGDQPRQCALADLLKALPVFRAHGNRRLEAETLHYIGNVLLRLYRSKEALDYILPAIELWSQFNEPRLSAAAFNNAGLAYDTLSFSEEAIEHYKEALKLWDVANDCQNKIGTITNLADLYSTVGQHESALMMFKNLLRFRCGERTAAIEVNILKNIGLVYYQMKEYTHALEYFQYALKRLPKTAQEFRGQRAAILNSIGSVNVQKRDFRRAIDSFDQAFALYSEPKYPIGQAAVFNSYGGAYSRRNSFGDQEKAVENYKSSLAILDSLDAPYRKADVLFNLAKAQREVGHLSEARFSIEEAINLLENIRSNASLKEIRQSYFAKKHFYYDFYITLLMNLEKLRSKGIDENYQAQALWASECARSRTLIDSLVKNDGGMESQLPRELISLLEHTRTRLAAAYQNRRRAVDKSDRRQVELADQNLHDAINAGREVERRFHRANAFLLKSERVSELQETLDNDTTYIEYYLGEQRSFVWLVRKEALRLVELEYGAAEIGSAVDELVAAITERTCRKRKETHTLREKRIQAGDRLQAKLAAQLSDMILKPLLPQLRTNRLVIIGDGKLQRLPFALLPVTSTSPNTDAAKLLIQNYEIAYAPSITVLREVRARTLERSSPPKGIAILANPVFEADDPRVNRSTVTLPRRSSSQSNNGLAAARRARQLTRSVNCGADGSRFERLPGTLAEAQGIVKVLGPRIESLIAVDFEANLTTLNRRDLDQYRVLHLATHAYVPPSAPERASVILSLVDKRGQNQPGHLGIYEISQLKLGADLVTLSACETGIGKDIEGEGLVGLARGFMYAGAPRVVASLWKVEDAPTAKLMEDFYAAMFNEGLSASAALRKAQLEMYERSPIVERKQPYFWAAFMLHGEWR